MKKQILPLLFLLLSINLFAQSAKNDIQEITEMILEQQNQTNTTQIDVRNFSEQGNYSFNSTGGLLNYNPNPAGNLFDGINLQAGLYCILIFIILYSLLYKKERKNNLLKFIIK